MNILLLFGLTLLITILVSFIFVWIRLPQVIGYIIVGILLGISGINLFDDVVINNLSMVTYFALSMIGFMIGGELRWARIKRFGASILIITVFESLFSCLLVFIAIYFLTYNLPLALLLGGLACATAPGGTTNVIQEFKARGQLTSTLYGVVGADDALAIIIFAFLSGISKVLVGVQDSLHVFGLLIHIISDIGGAIFLGFLLGFILSIWMLYVRSSDVRHLMTLVFILICAGLSVTLGVSLILSSMVMGIVVGNIRPHIFKVLFCFIASNIYPVIHVVFCFDWRTIRLWPVNDNGIGPPIIYFSFRMFGKYFGAITGAYLAKVPSKVRKNIGLCLFSQAGVAIGLALSIDLEFSSYNLEAQQLGASIVTIVTASTINFSDYWTNNDEICII